MKKVLLTTSSKSFLERNLRLLQGKGFQLLTATNGSESLRLHHQFDFDLILSDFELEDMSGVTLCSELRLAENSRQTPFVLICYNTSECLEKVKQSDASAMILRPVNPTKLLMTIGSFINMQLARSKRIIFTEDVITKTLNEEFISRSIDISATGILIESDRRLSIGETIDCHFRLFESAQIQIRGEIARCLNSEKGNLRYGVKFVNLTYSKRTTLERYVASNEHLEIIPKPQHLLERDLNQF